MTDRMRLSPRAWRTAPLFLALSCLAAGCATPVHDFVLFGDNPYRPETLPRVEALIEDVNRRGGLEWVIHVGDTKGGVQPCTDEFLRGRFELYQRFDLPFVLTPGDNDWFDCAGEAAGGWDEEERLEFLRRLHYPEPGRTTGGRAMAVRTQAAGADYAEFVENVLWERGGVVYATVHLIGLTRPPADPEAAARRLDAATAWIRTVFQVARERGSVGVFIATQADPWMVWGLPPLLRAACPRCVEPREGLESLYPALLEESTAFDGQVVLAVGDTHIFRVDKPLYREDRSLVENFTRVETFGDPYVHWVRVTVDPRTRSVFSFHQELVPGR